MPAKSKKSKAIPDYDFDDIIAEHLQALVSTDIGSSSSSSNANTDTNNNTNAPATLLFPTTRW
jgi:hypothetical protein